VRCRPVFLCANFKWIMTEIDWVNWESTEVSAGSRLSGTEIEVIREVDTCSARAVLFDFDGTLSLIRSGWVDVMVPMMVEVLLELNTGEDPRDLARQVRHWVERLTGKQTVYQMIELADQVRRRGGTPLDPVDYKHQYLDRLWHEIKHRIEGLRSGRIAPSEMLVPGSQELLEALRARGMKIFLASGTDEKYAAAEAELLGITPFIEEKVYGAIDDYKKFSKRMVIRRIISENDIGPGELLGIGDGYVEIEDVKEAGGVAVGVATDEPECDQIDKWKRKRLILAGADLIVPHYREHEPLLRYLFDDAREQDG